MWDSGVVALDFVEFSHLYFCILLLYLYSSNDLRDGGLVKAKPLLYKRVSRARSTSM